MKPLQFLRRALSASLLLAAGSGLAQNLNVTAGLQLWLKSDAGVSTNAAGGVVQWADQSGQANDAVPATDTQAPTLVPNALNNRPVLRFDGVDDYLDVADSDSLSIIGDISSFFVVKFDDFATFRAVWAKTAANLPAANDLYALPGSGVFRVYRGDGTPNNLALVDTAQGLPGNTYFVMAFSVSGDQLTHYLNNQANGVGTTTTNTADGGTALKIGTRSDFVTRLKGDLAELLIYDRALTDAERTNVFSYLQTKYNLLNLPPSVSLAGSPAGPNVTVGQVITLTATANDPDGSITKVDFFGNGLLVGTATAPPYRLRVSIDSAGTVQFTARATDNKGAVGNSAAVNYTAGPASGGEPFGDDLQMWLSADSDAFVGPMGGVIEWDDRSGFGNNALQPDESMAPLLVDDVLNGQPILRFDGMNDSLAVADSDSISIPGDLTTLYVARFADFMTFRGVWAKTAGNLPAPTDFYALPNSGLMRLYRGNGTGAGSQFVDAARAFPANTPLLAGFSIANNAVSHYLNGVANGGGTMTITPADTDQPLLIGTRGDGVTRFKGDLAEMLIYNRALSSSERRQTERYLAEKYGLPPLLSTTNTPPVVALTNPNGQPFTAPGSVTLMANASDSDGSVVSVEFFVGGRSIGTDTSVPYTAEANFAFGGQYRAYAIATDNLGARTRSATVELCGQGPGQPSGLVSYWPLDGNGTAVIGVNGNLVNGPLPAPDRNDMADGALAFDGALLQRVEVPGGGGLNAAGNGTISLWVKWTGIQDTGFGGSAGAILSRQQNGSFSDAIIQLSNADPNQGLIQWRQTGGPAPIALTGSEPVLDDIWRHVAITFTAADSALYVDGAFQASGTGGTMRNNTATPLAIGAWIGDGGSYSTSTIDDVAVWNRVLTPAEIELLAVQERTPLDLLASPDCLRIDRAGDQVVLIWGSNAILQLADEVTGPWDDLVDATSPYITSGERKQFFRLRAR